MSAVAPLTPAQQRTRARIETQIRLMAPGLNLVLAVGDRVSRVLEPEDAEYYPAREIEAPTPPPRRPSASE